MTFWCFTAIEWVQLICALTILVSGPGLIVQRVKAKKGIGVRAIQFIAVSTFVPGLVILSLNDKLDAAATAALIGAFVGYLFASISKFDDK